MVIRCVGFVLLVGLVFVSLDCGGRAERKEPLTVFYASSLEGAMARWSEMFRAREGVEVRGEASGSQDAARKVGELGRAADLVVVADYHVIDWLLVPAHAQWQIPFAGNEIVLAHSEQSRYAAELTADTWREILLRPDVRVARADENLAPIGYQTLQVWMLSDLAAGIATTDTQRSVAAQLRARIPPSLVRPDVKSLAALLGLQVDYVFLFRSVAHEHNLKYLRLPPAINLSDPNRAAEYARATATIVKSTRGAMPETITLRGSPILYGLTIPNSARQPKVAERFVQLILSERGQNVLEDLGFTVVRPQRARGFASLPKSLQPLVKAWDEDSKN
jgi:molybdate/tungstate transport system substrate-binding protein